MEVWWLLKKAKGGTEVTITHDMQPSRNPLLQWFRQVVVGKIFVENIAGKTLAGLKKHLEGL